MGDTVEHGYKKLLAYQKSYALVLAVYRVTRLFPKEELFGLVSQMRRCAVSVPSNIAEGYMRGSREYVQFLKVSLGSAAELETQISISKDLGYITESIFEDLYKTLEEVIKLLKSYINKLKAGK